MATVHLCSLHSVLVVAAFAALTNDTAHDNMPTEYAKPNQELGPLPQDLQPKRKLRPARKQVKPGEIDKSEGPQPGKEYSEFSTVTLRLSGILETAELINFSDFWYNKWAGGDKEDALARSVEMLTGIKD